MVVFTWMQVVMAFMMLTMIFIMFPRANVSAGRINEVIETASTIKNGTKDGSAAKEVGTNLRTSISNTLMLLNTSSKVYHLKRIKVKQLPL